jgi:hypothetical protein
MTTTDEQIQADRQAQAAELRARWRARQQQLDRARAMRARVRALREQLDQLAIDVSAADMALAHPDLKAVEDQLAEARFELGEVEDVLAAY